MEEKKKNWFIRVGTKILTCLLSIVKLIFVEWIGSGVMKIVSFASRKHKYEGIFLMVVSFLLLWIFIYNMAFGIANNQLFTLLGHFGIVGNVLGIILSGIGIAIASYFLYELVSKTYLKEDKKRFIIKRSITLFFTLILCLCLFDIWILNIASKIQTVTKIDKDTTFLETIAFFLRKYGSTFQDGIKTTLLLSLLGTIIGLILALLMVVLRLMEASPRDRDGVKFLKSIGSGFAKGYVTIIRGTPMIVQAFVFYYLVLGLFSACLSQEDYRNFYTNVWTPFRAGLFTVSINTTAYLTEVLRGGIQSVDKGQTEGALSLGFGKVKTMMLIVFPQAIKNSFPSIGNEFVINIKDTSVLSMIGVMDLFLVGNKTILGTGNYSGKTLETYLLVAVFYLILTLLTTSLLKTIEKKSHMPQKELTSSN